jgi:hypothetical protein
MKMGTSVISPMVFYLINVLSTLKVVMCLGICGAIVAVIFCSIGSLVEADSYKPDKEVINRWLKRSKTSIKFLVFFTVMFTFIPSENTMLTMLVADMITYENIELTKESAMALVNYIVEQVEAITG